MDATAAPEHPRRLTNVRLDQRWTEPKAAAGRVLVVLGPRDDVGALLAVAKRLARRLDGSAQMVVAGPKTLIPGNYTRAKTPAELADIVVDAADSTTVLVMADSAVAAHQKTNQSILAAIEPLQTWAVVDALEGLGDVSGYLLGMKPRIEIDALAAVNVWDCDDVNWLTQLGLPIGMVDFAPATPALWELVRTYSPLSSGR